jgi:predicted MFS family arabinose efflux permease
VIKNIKNKLNGLHPDMKFFLAAVIAFGFGSSLVDAIFNNFIDARFHIDGLQRTLLEVPRELPGLSVAFVSALLAFLPSRRMAALSGFLGCIGLITLGLFSRSFHWMMPWLFLYSLGQHIYLPVNQGIAMELAKTGQAGKRLGQISALRNATAIAGSSLVFLGFQYLHFNFTLTILIAAVSLLACGFCFYKMVPDKPHAQSMHLKLYKEYRLYYLLAILFGTRKQIFLTFAPWVLVTIFNQPTSMIARLLTIGGAVGIAIQPMVGHMIDRKGERFALSLEAVLLVFVCAGYALARDHVPPSAAFLIVAICFLLDQTLMSFNIARSTYMKKIAIDPSHITPTLTMAVTIDHIFSISIALLGGVLWRAFGYQSVFFAGIAIAVISWFVTQRMKRPAVKQPRPFPQNSP